MNNKYSLGQQGNNDLSKTQQFLALMGSNIPRYYHRNMHKPKLSQLTNIGTEKQKIMNIIKLMAALKMKKIKIKIKYKDYNMNINQNNKD